MHVTYKTKELQKYAEDARYSMKKLGVVISNNYTKRITALVSAETLGMSDIYLEIIMS